MAGPCVEEDGSHPHMNKRKLLIGLATAGTFSAGFGAMVLPAGADPRTFRVTLLGGAQIVITLDVPPGTPLDQIQVPGVDLPVLKVEELGAPAPTPAPTETAPATESPATTDPTKDAQAPVVEQQSDEGQEATGKAKKKAKSESDDAKDEALADEAA